MTRTKRARKPRRQPRATEARAEKSQELQQAESTLADLRKKKSWPVSAKVWLALYRDQWGVQLKKGDPAYTKLSRAQRNDTYRRAQKEKEQVRVEEEAEEAKAIAVGAPTLARENQVLWEKCLAQLEEIEALKKELREAVEELAAAQKLRVAAEEKTEYALGHTEQLKAIYMRLEALRANKPPMNWQHLLNAYLRLPDAQGDRDTTTATLRSWLQPWVNWLGERRMPTTQLLKQYLMRKKYTRESYFRIGKAVVKFTNWHLNKEEPIELVPPMGPVKRRATFRMPDDVKAALNIHLEEKLSKFEPPQGSCKTPEDWVRAAKYIGKYHLLLSARAQ